MFARHARHAAATRAAVEAWGLEVLALDPREQSPVLTGVVVPDGVDADEVRARDPRALRHVARRRAREARRAAIFRIGHLGDFNDLMLAGTLCGVEMGLRLAGVPIEPRRARRSTLERERAWRAAGEPVAA